MVIEGICFFSLSLSLSLSLPNHRFRLLLILFTIFTVSVNIIGLTTESMSDVLKMYDMDVVKSRLESYITTQYANETNSLAWGGTYAIMSLFRMYRVTGDLKYLDMGVEYTKRIMDLRDDKRGVVSRTNADGSYETRKVWRYIKAVYYRVDSISLEAPKSPDAPKPSFHDFIVKNNLEEYCKIDESDADRIDTMILYPDSTIADTEEITGRTKIVNFLELTRSDFATYQAVISGLICETILEMESIIDSAGLWSRYGGMLGYDKNGILSYVKESLEEHDTEWHEYDFYGVYEWPSRGEIYKRLIWHSRFDKYDTIGTNQIMGTGRALLKYAEITKDIAFEQKATDIASALKRILYRNNLDAYEWMSSFISYDTEGTGKREDISHGVLTVGFLYNYINSYLGTVMNKEYYGRGIANTMLENMFMGDVGIDEFNTTEVLIKESGTDGLDFMETDPIDEGVAITVPTDGIYDLYPLVDGSIILEGYNKVYDINWCRYTAGYWVDYQKYDPRLFELAYNVLDRNASYKYVGIAYLLSNWESYAPAKIEVSKPTLTYNSDNYLEIIVSSINMLGNFRYILYQEGGDIYAEGGIATKDIEDHIIQVNNIRTKSSEDVIFKYWSDNDGILGPAKEVVIPVVGDTLYVSHIDEIPVLKLEDIGVRVQSKQIPDPYPEANMYYDLPGCTIDVYYSGGIIERGITNSLGVVKWINKNIDNTTPLKVIAYKDGYFPDTSYIEPYMWSTIQDAMGPSSSKHVIKNDKDGSVHLVYTDGDSIIHGRSTDFGANWILEKIGHGDYASITQIIDTDSVGIAAVWKDGESWVYDWSMSPWVGEDTVSPTVMGYRNPVITVNPSNRKEVWLGGIMSDYGTLDNNWTLQYAGFNYRNPDASQITEIISEYGEVNLQQNYLIKPYNNASIGSKLWGSLYGAVMAFEDTNSEIIEKQFNPNIPLWQTSTNRSNTSTKSSNPFVNTENYTDVNKVIWEEEGSSSGAYGSRIYLDNARFKYDKTETDKRYPKIIKGIVSYVESGNKVVICPQLYDSTKGNIILSSSDSCYHPDFVNKISVNIGEMKKYNKIRTLWTEKSGSEYRIKLGYTEIVTDTTDDGWGIDNLPLTLADTAILTAGTTSYLRDYLPSGDKQKIERITSTMTGLNKYKDYLLVVKTTNPNKNQPYVVAVDEKLSALITEKEAITEVVLKSSDYEDGEIGVYLDRVKGSPNRIVEFNLYEYDEIIGGATVLKGANILKLTDENEGIEEKLEMSKINGKTIKMSINSLTDSEIGIELIDITGRVVLKETERIKKGKNQISMTTEGISSGVYFYKMKKDGTETMSGKLTVIK